MSSVTCGSRDFLTIEALFWAVSRGKGRSCPFHRRPCRLRVGETRPKSRPPPTNRRRLSGSVRNRPAFRLALPLARSSPASTPSRESVVKPMRLPPLSPKSASFSMVENRCRNRSPKNAALRMATGGFAVLQAWWKTTPYPHPWIFQRNKTQHIGAK